MPAQDESAIHARVDGFQKFKSDAWKIGNFSDEFSGTSCGFSAGLGLNPDSCDIQLSTSF